MTNILINFSVNLGSKRAFYDGPLFHRWLPDREKDAITVGVAAGHLQLWFERRGYVDNGSVVFDRDRREVDETIVSKQGMLDGGPLFGRLHLRDVSDQELEVLSRNQFGDPAYRTLGKRIVKIAFPVVARLIGLLRARYGQYWLPALDPWDSRDLSLGAFAADWNMRWSNNGADWRRFEPEKAIRNYPIENTKFDEYLTQSDWLDVKALIERGGNTPLAAELITNGHRLLAEGQFRYAAVEAASALELALAEIVRGPIQGSQELMNSAAAFLKDTPLKTRLAVIASLMSIPTDTVEDAFAGIELRNSVVHQGLIPQEKHLKNIRALLVVAARLVPGPRLKFPVLSGANCVAGPEKWQAAGGFGPLSIEGISILSGT